MTTETFGHRLRNERLKLKLTQERLGLRCKQPMLQSQIAQYENDHRVPNPDNITQLVVALGCNYKDLMRPKKYRPLPAKGAK